MNVTASGDLVVANGERLTVGEEPVTLYPNGYGTQLVTMQRLRELHEPKMHPEFAARLFKWIESKGGQIGIGGGWRPTPDPVSPASSQGRSFHQDQRFASGFVGYSAVDLVARNPGKIHRSPTWAESADAPPFGVHTFIKLPDPEPWHMQCVEMRGWQTWVDAGRPDPAPWGAEPEPPEVPPMLTLRDVVILHDGPVDAGVKTFLVPGLRPAGYEAAVIKITVDGTPITPGFVIFWDGVGDWRTDPDRRGDVTWRSPDGSPTNQIAVPLHPVERHTFKMEATTAIERVCVELRGWTAVL